MKKKILSSISITFCGFFSFGSSVFAASLVQCGNVNNIPSKLPYFVWLAFTLIKYITPVLIIVLGSLDFFKAITANDSDMLAKTFKVFSKRLIAGVVVFLVFILFQITISLVAKKSTGFTQCLSCFLTDPDQCTVDTTTGVTTTPVNEDDIIDGYNNSQTEFDNDTDLESVVGKLPYNLSTTRKKILEVAVSAIGKIPYYYGGYATVPGLDGNNFESTVSADARGRTKKGLDCSHFVDWVFWTAIGDNLGNGTTTTLWNASKEISKGDLEIGDIGFLETSAKEGTENHVGVYAGNDLWVHENSTDVNVNITPKDFKYFRRVVED